MSTSAAATIQTPRRPINTSSSSSSTLTPFKTPLRTPGEQTSHTPVVNFDLIEFHKENVQPSSRGRSAHSLSQTLGLKHKERAEELAIKRREFEARVTAEKLEESDDPLVVWEDYVDWVTESYPSGGTSADSGLVPLLERATRSLKDDERYKDSYPYLRLWLIYSRNVESAELVLNWLLANDVGTKCAALYEEAASLAESKRLYESADSLYRLGVSRSATPLPRLKRRYDEFKTRILRNQSAPGSSSDFETTSGLTYTQALERAMRESKRVTLGTKDEKAGRSFSANAVRGNGQSAGIVLGPKVGGLANNGRKLGVFKDADGNRSQQSTRGPEMGELGSRDARRQENTKESKPWKGERLLQKNTSTASTAGKAPIKIFQDSDEDEEQQPARTPKKDHNVFNSKAALGSQCTEADLLKRNPFSLWSQDVQKAAEALKGVELGDVAKLGVGRELHKKAAVARPVSNSSSSSKVGASNRDRSGSKSSKSSTNLPDVAAGSSNKRPERLAVPEHLLYPDGDVLAATSSTSTSKSNECSMDEVRSLLFEWPLNIDGDEKEDPWSYLDVPVASHMVDAEEQDEGEATLPTIEGSSTPVQVSYGLAQASCSSLHDASSAEEKERPRKKNPNMTLVGAREPTVTAFTREANRAALELINGPGSDEDEDSDSEEPESESEEDEEDYVPRGGVPPTPTPLQRGTGSSGANLNSGPWSAAFVAAQHVSNENALAHATPLGSASSGSRGFAGNSRGGLGTSAPVLPAATPLKKPLSGLGLAAKKNIFVEEDEQEDGRDNVPSLTAPRAGAKRVLPSSTNKIAEEEGEGEEDDDDEESDADEDGRAYNYAEGQDLLEGGARYDQLTTISERTEYETRWGIATPGKSRVVSVPEEEDEGEEGQGSEQSQVPGRLEVVGAPVVDTNDERSFVSEESSQDQASRSQFSGGQADFQLSPGYTIEKHEERTTGWQDTDGSKDDAAATSTALVTTAPNPCSPTDPEVIELVLTALALPIESSPDYRDCTDRVAQQLTGLKKRAKAQSRKSVGNSSFVGSRDWNLEIDNVVFSVREMLGEGAYGSVFLAEDVANQVPSSSRSKGQTLGGITGDSSFAKDDDEEDEEQDEDEDEDEDEAERKRMVAVKVESPPNRWEFYVLGQLRARLEARALQSIISARRFYAFRDESYLVLEWGEKGTLLELVNQASVAGVAPIAAAGLGAPVAGGSTGVEEVLAMFFTIELLRLVESLHKARLLHGDLKIDNVLLRLEEPPTGTTWSNTYSRDGSGGWASKGVHLLDFGRAIDLSVFPRGQTFIADWQTDPRDCAEMREGRPWTHQVDYFGVASIAYCLLFGKYIETTWVVEPCSGIRRQKIVGSWKRWWQGDLWNKLFEVLLNPKLASTTSGKGRQGQMPIPEVVADVRREMEDWLEVNCLKGGKNLKGLLKKLEIWSMKRRP